MTWHSLYYKADGMFTGRECRVPSGTVPQNSADGFAWIRGRFDHLSQRVDISVQPPSDTAAPRVIESTDPVTGDTITETLPPEPWYPPVIDYQPPAPANDQWQTWAWDTSTKRWVSTPTLAAHKRTARQRMKTAALAADVADITLQGSTIAADADTRTQLYNEALVAQMALIDAQAFSLTWERTDGSTVTLTAAQLKNLIRAIRQRSDDIRAQYRARVQTINSAATQAAVETVVW